MGDVSITAVIAVVSTVLNLVFVWGRWTRGTEDGTASLTKAVTDLTVEMARVKSRTHELSESIQRLPEQLRHTFTSIELFNAKTEESKNDRLRLQGEIERLWAEFRSRLSRHVHPENT